MDISFLSSNSCDEIEIFNSYSGDIKQEKEILKSISTKASFLTIKTHRDIIDINSINQQTPINTFKCPTCKKPFTSLKGLKKHIKLHSNERNYLCKICNKSYKRSDHLNRHILTHKESSYIYKCQYCDFTAYLKHHLKSHLNNIHLLNPFKFQCEFCNLCFPKKMKLLKHIRREHKEKIAPIEKKNCYYPYCHKTFDNEAKLERHVQKDHKLLELGNENENEIDEIKRKKEPIYYKCPYEDCLKIYSTQFNLNTHIKTFHLKIKSFKCEFCNAEFFHKSSHKRHVKNMHKEKISLNKEELNNLNNNS